MKKLKSDSLNQVISYYQKQKGTHLLSLLDTLHRRPFELPDYEVTSFIELLERDIETYNKYNDSPLELRKTVKNDITTVKVRTKLNNKSVELCNFKIYTEPKINNMSMNDITDYFNKLNRRKFELNKKSRKKFLIMIEDYIDNHNANCEKLEKLNYQITGIAGSSDTIISITKGSSNHPEIFSEFTIVEI